MSSQWSVAMATISKVWIGLIALLAAGITVSAPATAHQQQKPNLIVIMGDDVGMWNIGAYHRELMAGETPNLDQLATEGMLFTDYYAEGSCTAGRTNFIIGELPIRTGMIVGQAGSQPGARFKLGEVKAEIEKKIASLAAQ
jgi:hypothetical protein